MAFIAQYNHYNTTTKSIDPAQAEKKAYIAVKNIVDIPADYTNISSLENINSYGLLACRDFLAFHFLLKNYFYDNLTWATCTDEEKDIVIDNTFYTSIYDANADTNKVTHLMTVHSMTQLEAENYLLNAYSNIQSKLSESTYLRTHPVDGALINIVGKYLLIDDALDFNDRVRTHIQDYENHALIGTRYSRHSTKSGIDDYINDVIGSDYETTGLSSVGYSIQNGLTLQQFQDELSDYLIRKY